MWRTERRGFSPRPLTAGEGVLDEKGKIDPKKLRPVVYDPVNHACWTLGEPVGQTSHDGAKLK